MNGSQQICFTDSAGKALFSIPDNGLLCLFYGNGDRHFAVCHRLDDTLVAKKDRKFFRIHKCVNPKCPYYLYNLKKVEQKDLVEDYGKNKYKLHYIYREFTVDFFAMDLNSLPKNASSLKFSKHNAHVMSLCLTLHINLGLSLRKAIRIARIQGPTLRLSETWYPIMERLAASIINQIYDLIPRTLI